jgi:hypothetical protein
MFSLSWVFLNNFFSIKGLDYSGLSCIWDVDSAFIWAEEYFEAGSQGFFLSLL